jgi:hypothetical protein
MPCALGAATFRPSEACNVPDSCHKVSSCAMALLEKQPISQVTTRSGTCMSSSNLNHDTKACTRTSPILLHSAALPEPIGSPNESTDRLDVTDIASTSSRRCADVASGSTFGLSAGALLAWTLAHGAANACADGLTASGRKIEPCI